MASAYPGGLDTFSTTIAGTDARTGHATQHNNVNDAINKIEAELGVNPSLTAATVAALLAAIPSANVVRDTDGTLAANSDTVIPSQKAVKTYADAIATTGIDTSYALQVCCALEPTPADSQTWYWGGSPPATPGGAGTQRVYIPYAGTIKTARIYSYAGGTAGSNENWSMYVRLNNTTDTLIQTLASSSANRIWANDSLAIAVVAGDYIEIKEITPAWATNPTNISHMGVLFIQP